MAFDHTDALRSPMSRPAPECPDPFAGLEAGDLTHVPHTYVRGPLPLLRPAEPTFVNNPHTRIGY